MSRAADFERIVLGESLETPQIISNVDKLWNAIINNASVLPIVPQTNIERYLAHLIDSGVEIPQPETRIDTLLYAICTSGTLEDVTPLSENEELLYEILEEGLFTRATAQGVSLTLENSKGRNLYAYNIYGNSVQDGTPTPESQVDIVSVGSGGSIIAETSATGEATIETTVVEGIELRKIENISDILEKHEDGTATLTRKIGTKVFDGTEVFSVNTQTDTELHLVYVTTDGCDVSNYDSENRVYSNILKGEPAVEKFTLTDTIIMISLKRLLLSFLKSQFETVESFKDFLSEQYANNTPAVVYYQLATPTTETVLLAEIPTFEGTTTVSIFDNIQPSNMECEYYATNI